MSDKTEDPGTMEPPTTMRGILRQLGPGLIIPGSIVGSASLRVFGVPAGDERSQRWWIRVFCITLPLLFLASFASK